ncbi:MAG: DNA-processing protein DprA [Candidatus Doudnabacteria bacterium]
MNILLHYNLALLQISGWRLTQENLEILLANQEQIIIGNFSQLNLNKTQQKNLSLAQQQIPSKDFFEEQLTKNQIKTTSYFDSSYPKRLKELFDPPLLLFYIGDLKILDHISIAIVGNRKVSSYGKLIPDILLKDFMCFKITIISGLAYGIDTLSHQAALKYQLPTCAVLGGGLSDQNLYPKTNLSLAKQIIKNGGLLLSEYYPHNQARGYQFVARNRIIAALSHLTVIAECPQKSGALITAQYAIELGKPTGAVPGSILTQQSRGSHQLLEQGAFPIINAQSIANILQLELPNLSQSKPSVQLSQEAQAVLKCIQKSPSTLDQIILQTQISPQQILTAITELEINEMISNASMGVYTSHV